MTVEFGGGIVKFDMADTRLSGEYKCTDGLISGSAGGGPFSGKFDASRNILTWNGEEYERVE